MTPLYSTPPRAPSTKLAQAMVLAAGRGERLRPWTDTVPKPLLKVGRHRLIEWHLLALAQAGVTDVVINTAWLEEQFPLVLGDGTRYGLRIHWSFEKAACGGALETAGGIATALPLLEPVFWVVSADVFVPGFTFPKSAQDEFRASDHLAKLWLAANAPHHPGGDFGLTGEGLASRQATPRWTWSSLGLFRRELFQGLVPGQRLALRPLLDQAAETHQLAAARLHTPWVDVGSPDRWAQARAAADNGGLRA